MLAPAGAACSPAPCNQTVNGEGEGLTPFSVCLLPFLDGGHFKLVPSPLSVGRWLRVSLDGLCRLCWLSLAVGRQRQRSCTWAARLAPLLLESLPVSLPPLLSSCIGPRALRGFCSAAFWLLCLPFLVPLMLRGWFLLWFAGLRAVLVLRGADPLLLLLRGWLLADPVFAAASLVCLLVRSLFRPSRLRGGLFVRLPLSLGPLQR